MTHFKESCLAILNCYKSFARGSLWFNDRTLYQPYLQPSFHPIYRLIPYKVSTIALYIQVYNNYATCFQYLYSDIVFLCNQMNIYTRRNFQHLNIHLHFHMVQNHTVILKHFFTILVKGIQRVSTNIEMCKIKWNKMKSYLFPDIVFLYNQKDIYTQRNFQHLNIHLHSHMVQNHTEILNIFSQFWLKDYKGY
jgi:hypothetical protein